MVLFALGQGEVCCLPDFPMISLFLYQNVLPMGPPYNIATSVLTLRPSHIRLEYIVFLEKFIIVDIC